jgi:hypothetical protein
VARAVRRIDETWYREGLGKLSEDNDNPYHQAAREWGTEAPPQWGVGQPWASWSAMDWRNLRVWSLARITRCIPLACWNEGEFPASLPVCPLCGEAEVDLAHVVTSCIGTRTNPGSTMELSEELRGAPDLNVVRLRAQHVGRACAAIVSGMRMTRMSIDAFIISIMQGNEG